MRIDELPITPDKVMAALEKKAKGDQKTGVDIVRRALVAPLKQIAVNGGLDGSIVLQKVQESSDTSRTTGLPSATPATMASSARSSGGDCASTRSRSARAWRPSAKVSRS